MSSNAALVVSTFVRLTRAEAEGEPKDQVAHLSAHLLRLRENSGKEAKKANHTLACATAIWVENSV